MFDQNSFNNGNFAGYGGYYQPQGTGAQWNPNPTPSPKRMNVLTTDEIEKLTRQDNKFSLALTETDKARAACNHRTADGTGFSLVDDVRDGVPVVRCTICGYEFEPLGNLDDQELKAATRTIVNILNAIKMTYVDLDPTVARQYFQIIPLIDKIPDLYKLASANYAKHENAMGGYGYNTNGNNTIGMFNYIMGFLGGQQPQGYNPYAQQAQPGFNPYQQGYNPYGTAPGYNPYAQPAQSQQPQGQPQGYTAQTNGFQTTYGAAPQGQSAPQAQQPQGQPAAQPADAGTTTKTFTA